MTEATGEITPTEKEGIPPPEFSERERPSEVDERRLALERAEEILTQGKFTSCERLKGGVSESYIVKIALGEEEIQAIYKPDQGIGAPEHAVAAYIVSKFLSKPLVPPTAIREGPNGKGSVQLFIEQARDTAEFSREEREKIDREALGALAIFDYLTDNIDRNPSKNLIADPNGNLYAIDNENSFWRAGNDEGEMDKVGRAITRNWRLEDQDIPEWIKEDIRRLLTSQERQQKMREMLGLYLEEEKINGLFKRAARLRNGNFTVLNAICHY